MSSRQPKLRHHRRRRLNARPGLAIGLTGSVAMGKSTAARLLRSMGIPVFDSDAVVHGLLQGEARAAILKKFPDVADAKGINRQKLGAQVFANPKALADLEAILHPLVGRARTRFLNQAALVRRPIVAIDVPLLFEGNTQGLYDAVVVVSAPAFLQHQRALARPGMSKTRLAGILARQWPDARKRRHADVVIPTGIGKRETLRRLKQFLKLLTAKNATA